MWENVKNLQNHVVGRRFHNETKPQETFHCAWVYSIYILKLPLLKYYPLSFFVASLRILAIGKSLKGKKKAFQQIQQIQVCIVDLRIDACINIYTKTLREEDGKLSLTIPVLKIKRWWKTRLKISGVRESWMNRIDWECGEAKLSIVLSTHPLLRSMEVVAWPTTHD